MNTGRSDPELWCDFDDGAATASKIPFGTRGSRIIETNDTNDFNAVVQMDIKGNCSQS